jgi:hypothetical protein
MLSALVVGMDGVNVGDLKRAARFQDLSAIRQAFDAMLVEAGFIPRQDDPLPGEDRPAPAPAAPSATE